MFLGTYTKNQHLQRVPLLNATRNRPTAVEFVPFDRLPAFRQGRRSSGTSLSVSVQRHGAELRRYGSRWTVFRKINDSNPNTHTAIIAFTKVDCANGSRQPCPIHSGSTGREDGMDAGFNGFLLFTI